MVKFKGSALLSMFTLRLISVALIFIANLFLVKLFPLSIVGQYYLLTALAYFGHALYFLGCDLYLQSKMKTTSKNLSINLPSLRWFLVKTSLPGVVMVFFISSLFFLLTDQSGSIINNALVIVLITLSTYFSLIMKNILQIIDFKIYFLVYLIIESVVKLAVILAFGLSDYFNPMMLLLSIYALILIQFGIFYLFLAKETVKGNKVYFRSYRSLLYKVYPTAKSAVLNWLHLHAYKPASSSIGLSSTNLGIISYLIALGSSASQAFIGLIFQKMLPAIYSSNGGGAKKFILILCITCFILVLLSLPVSIVFIDFIGKAELSSYFWLVAIGVIIEFLNAIVGVVAVFANIRSVSLMNKISVFNLYGFLSLILCYLSLLYVVDDIVIRFSLSLLISQVIVTLLVFFNYLKFKED
tara:strand:- start:14637 stop:15872 length:1236 start_codon:yes stop_codon:yes gene_type:complete